MNYEVLFLQSLALTICIESVVLWIMIKLIYKIDKPLNTLLFTGVFASFATLPYVWFIFPAFISVRWAYILSAESFAVIVETLIIHYNLKTGYSRSFILSLVCNMVSFGIGLIIK
jgi:hypothetical protein